MHCQKGYTCSLWIKQIVINLHNCTVLLYVLQCFFKYKTTKQFFVITQCSLQFFLNPVLRC